MKSAALRHGNHFVTYRTLAVLAPVAEQEKIAGRELDCHGSRIAVGEDILIEQLVQAGNGYS